MNDTQRLDATIRTVVGKKVRHFRSDGQVPAVVYGRDFIPFNIFVNELELRSVLTKCGGTRLIELMVDGSAIPTLAREVQRHPVKGTLIHVDFYRVAMDRPIRAEVPLTLVGTSPAVSRREAIILHTLHSLVIEVLPAELPAFIEVDVSGLEKVGDHFLVSDLRLPSENIKVIAQPDDLVLKLDYAESIVAEEEVEAAPVSAEVEVITAKKLEEEPEA